MRKFDDSIAQKLVARAVKRGQLDIPETVVVAKRVGTVRREFIFAAFLLMLTIYVDHFLVASRLGHDINAWAYERLQATLPAGKGATPVVVVDIGNQLDIDDAGTTDLGRLQILLKNVLQCDPRAVAIDIDFGYLEKSEQWLDADGKIADIALNSTKAGVPVFLAVGRNLHRQSPDQWLGKTEYLELVAHPFFPPEGLTTGLVSLPESLTIGEHTHNSISKRLSDVSGIQSSAGIFTPFVSRYESAHGSSEHHSEETGGVIFGHRQYINFASLDLIKKDTLQVLASGEFKNSASANALLKDALVIIGYVDPVRDGWTRPDTKSREGGVYLHAVATDTMVNSPTFHFQPLPNIILNVAGLVFILMAMTGVQIRNLTKLKPAHTGTWVTIFTLIAVAGVVTFAFVLAASFQILWIDFVLVAALVLIHPSIEHRLSHISHRVIGFFSRSKRETHTND